MQAKNIGENWTFRVNCRILRDDRQELLTDATCSPMTQSKNQRTAANTVRSARAAALDNKVFDAMKLCIDDWKGKITDGTDLRQFGFPEFAANRPIRQRIIGKLGACGITPPRGGKWTVRQIHRALLRCASRMEVVNDAVQSASADGSARN